MSYFGESSILKLLIWFQELRICLLPSFYLLYFPLSFFSLSHPTPFLSPSYSSNNNMVCSFSLSSYHVFSLDLPTTSFDNHFISRFILKVLIIVKSTVTHLLKLLGRVVIWHDINVYIWMSSTLCYLFDVECRRTLRLVWLWEMSVNWSFWS